eukprot:CAMPEP_0179159392 /NCGR_PEP_ID=MMETSP0796-20121207/77847_1 /TAXON_ID=73915 /ORGANISM="Pyrodinium bahamense, Strain pbaha01" /LENGTH=32 /DNA_ID= /DNA_START= /DNA_END= /DNA_ORIENTATION=
MMGAAWRISWSAPVGRNSSQSALGARHALQQE